MASKLCDSCKSATATLFCRADSAFLCVNCDSKVHGANKLASRHARVWVCEVCEQAPAHVTCKADAAALCVTCDCDIHSANPLARRHERVPVTPFYDSVESVSSCKPNNNNSNLLEDNRGCFSDVDAEEAEAASWLLPNPTSKAVEENNNNNDDDDEYVVLSDMDPYLDVDYGAVEQNSSGADGVVPVHGKSMHGGLVNESSCCFDLEFSTAPHHHHNNSKSFAYGYPTTSPTHCLSHSVSSSSLEVGVVPDGGADVSNNTYVRGTAESSAQRTVGVISSADREARVLRYREKRKNRKFEKTIRYASRKAYAETRPRIKGRFAKRTDIHLHVDPSNNNTTTLLGFGVVPSF